MKYEIYCKDKPADTPVRLRLVTPPERDGEAVVIAVDWEGKRIDSGFLVSLTLNGRVWRCSGVNSKLGFEQDEEGRIKEE